MKGDMGGLQRPEMDCDVVIVGAGPAGLASALTLGSYGIQTIVVERRPSPSALPRANALSTGTMELLRRWGLETAVRERAIDVEMKPLALPSLAAADRGEPVDAGFPTPEQAALVSPTSPASLGQDELEPLLEEHLDSADSVRIERGIELVALESQSQGGYLLALADGTRQLRIRARYVIGADGIRSRVRDALGIPTEGSAQLEERLSIHFRAPLWDVVGSRRHVIYFLTDEPEGRAVLPVGRPDRWVLAGRWDSSTDDVDQLAPHQLNEWILDAAGVEHLPIEIVRTSVVGYGIGLAQRFREGNAFLIGDAAHRVTPRGATGLNTAIRDGFDLGWKLAWVLRDWAPDRLLDSYEDERRPVAEFNTGRSVRPDGSILPSSVGLNADIGGRIAHVWVSRGSGLVSTLDLLGEGLTQLVGPDWVGSAPHGTAATTIERLDAIAARGLGLAPTGSLLVRPDGHPVALRNEERASGADGRSWSAAYATLFTALRV
jgi:putative polyketide hydroxylase